MITFVSKPNAIAFSKNPVIFQLKTTDANGIVYRAKGQSSDYSLHYSNALAPGETLTLKFTEPNGSTTSITFTQVASPTEVNQVPTGATLQQIAAIINAHYLISPKLNVYYNSENSFFTITAEAKEVEPAWTVEWITSRTDGVPVITTPDYTLNNAPVNYRVNYQIFFEKKFMSGAWSKAHEGELTPRGDGGDLYLNISDVLDSEAFASLPENPFKQYATLSQTATDNVRRYFVNFREVSDTLNTDYATDGVREVIIGGVPNEIWLNKDWFDFGLIEAKAWLTHKPSLWKIRRDQTEWLTWFNYTGQTSNVRLQIQKYYFNGGVDASWSTVTNTLSQVQNNNAVTFNISAQALSIDDTVAYFSVRVVWADFSDRVISTERMYNIDDLPRLNVYTLAYLNQFGAPETLSCIGEVSRSVSLTSLQTVGVRGIDAGGLIAKDVRNVVSFDKLRTYRTNYLNAKEKESLTEIVASYVLFDISNHNYIALKIKEAKSTKPELVKDDGEFNYTWAFDTEVMIKSSAFAPDDYENNNISLAEPKSDLRESGTGVAHSTGTTGGGVTITQPTFLETTSLPDTDLILIARPVNSTTVNIVGIKASFYKKMIRAVDTNLSDANQNFGIRAGATQKIISIDATNVLFLSDTNAVANTATTAGDGVSINDFTSNAYLTRINALSNTDLIVFAHTISGAYNYFGYKNTRFIRQARGIDINAANANESLGVTDSAGNFHLIKPDGLGNLTIESAAVVNSSDGSIAGTSVIPFSPTSLSEVTSLQSNDLIVVARFTSQGTPLFYAIKHTTFLRTARGIDITTSDYASGVGVGNNLLQLDATDLTLKVE